uniref:RRM domain-containing protein n=1 Tax=Alexandrium andersonii TaxID=327968 RepID=A0A7S2NFI5_9DINO|mmetsp:Transcript_93729/g.209972  ORF Transcript_93729/g.209972 Transcript_93729/m.209972 type:complete len:278 (+) Transcript_93729:139-972(+)
MVAAIGGSDSSGWCGTPDPEAGVTLDSYAGGPMGMDDLKLVMPTCGGGTESFEEAFEDPQDSSDWGPYGMPPGQHWYTPDPISSAAFAAGFAASGWPAAAQAASHAEEAQPGPAPERDAEPGQRVELNTTVMIRNIPTRYSREELVELLGQKGFRGRFTFVHLPIDLRSDLCQGYAFVDMRTHEDAANMWQEFTDLFQWGESALSPKKCRISWATLQGLEGNIEKYRNNDLMHPSVDDRYRPALYDKDGQRERFPRPTKKLRPPRTKHGADPRPHER